MNKTLFSFVIIAGLLGLAFSQCDTSAANGCTQNGGTCSGGTTCADCDAGFEVGDVGGTNDGCLPICDESCTDEGTGCDAVVAGDAEATCSGCTTTGYYLGKVNHASDGCVTCGSICTTNGGTCSDAGICQRCSPGTFKPGKVNAFSSDIHDGCVAYATANPTTNSYSSAFNVTPVAVFAATEYTSPSAFAYASETIMFSGGFDDQNYYVWSAITSGTTYAFNRRTLAANFTRETNSTTDVAISTTFTDDNYATACAGAGYLGVLTRTKDEWGTDDETISEIYFQSVSVDETAFTSAKALTGNTNKNVILTPQQCWYDNAGGVFYVTWVQSTRSAGTDIGVDDADSTTAETWTLNGLYIQGVFPNGTLFYSNSTSGVLALALTTVKTGTCTSDGTSGQDCTDVEDTASSTHQSTSMPSVSFYFGRQNFTLTNDTTVSYVMYDNTGSAYTYKYGTINLGTGVGTAGTVLVTEVDDISAYGDATEDDPYVSTSFSYIGSLGSTSTWGVFLQKSVTTCTAPDTDDCTTVYTVLPYYNGSTTVSTVAVPAAASGYGSVMITGYGTENGFILVERWESTAATGTSSPFFPNSDLLQAEAFFANGTAVGTAVSLGTFMDSVQHFQDTNGSIVAGWATEDYANLELHYAGYMGKYLQQYLGASSLTSIIVALSLVIVALFAF